MDTSSQDNNERLHIDRFTMRGLIFEVDGDLAVKVGREGLDMGESGTVLIALNAQGLVDVDVVVVEHIPDPIQQMDQAIETLIKCRDKLAALLALAEGDES